MSRKLRIEYPGAMYHVMNRGDQREDIFRDDHDRQKFLTTLGEACVKRSQSRACTLAPGFCRPTINY
jgi:REP element-mobilizing transposase RayT